MAESENAKARIAAVGRLPMAFGLVMFGFGLAGGFLLTFSGYGLEDSAELIVTMFLGLILVLCVVGAILYLFRKPLMRRAFGVADSQLELFATPLARVAEGAAERDPTGTIAAARELAQLSFARYAWLSTRRWLLATLTGLIAAMAALSGTALLFKQNQHLEEQVGLMKIQNTAIARQLDVAELQTDRVAEQNALLATQVELAEAARNAEIAVEITNIAGLLGQALSRRNARDRADGIEGPDDPWAAFVPVMDPVTDIDQSLLMRIVSASRASKPYRFLQPLYVARDTGSKIRQALKRRPDLFANNPQLSAQMNEGRDVDAQSLIDLPASPERAQLLEAMINSGLRALEVFNFYGLDLSFAHANDLRLFAVSMQGAQMSYASLARAELIEVDLRGASLENARLTSANIRDSRFGSVLGDEANGPYRRDGDFFPSFLAGTSFEDALIRDTTFDATRAVAVSFDGATLQDVSFAFAGLNAGTFRDAVILSADFTGAGLRSVDFDGAFVLRPDFLDMLTEVAEPDSFRADRYEIEERPVADLMAALSTGALAIYDTPQQIADLAGGSFTVWRIRRVADF